MSAELSAALVALAAAGARLAAVEVDHWMRRAGRRRTRCSDDDAARTPPSDERRAP